MNKIALGVVLLLSIQLSAQVGFTTESQKLSGLVKSVSMTVYDAEGEIDWLLTALTPNVHTFDSSGRLIQVQQVLKNGDMFNSYNISYPNDTIIIKYHKHLEEERGVEVFLMDHHKNVISVYVQHNTRNLFNFNLDSLKFNSNIIVDLKYSNSGLVISRKIYEVNKGKRLVNYSVTSKYNAKNLKVEEVHEGLDTNGNKKTIYSYNDQDLLQTEKVYRHGALEQHMVYSYNSQNLVVSKTRYKADSKYLETYEYVVDQYGNWIESRSYKGGELYQTKKRAIEYY